VSFGSRRAALRFFLLLFETVKCGMLNLRAPSVSFESEIAMVEGVDMILIGTNDLSAE
jgi:hypothetical protein